MIEVLQFVFSGFWVWLGCFLMLSLVCGAVASLGALLSGRDKCE